MIAPMKPSSPLRHLSLAVVAASFVVACASGPANDQDPQVVFETPYGRIVAELYPRAAPATVANFLAYVDRDGFSGANFYRVVTPGNQPGNDIKIEVIQGGLTMDDDHPGRLPEIVHETTRQTGLFHGDGVLSMARDEPGTASSEFFITVGPQPELDYGGRRNPDGQGFAVFGRVIEGLDVVRTIQGLPEVGQMLTETVPITAVRRLDPRAAGDDP